MLDFNNDSLILEFLSSLKDVNNIYFKIPKNIINCKIHQLRIIPCYDGKYLKSINTLYNKKLSSLKSRLPKNVYISKLIRQTMKNRNNKINDYISKAVNKTIFKMKELNISKLIIGWNKYIKNGGVKNNKLTKKQLSKVNQHFVGLPLSKLKDKLIYKAKENDIEVTVINESYTSKASALDNDKFNNELPFNGKRITRGLYKTSNNNNIINVDINAALNMIRKCNSNEELNIQMSRGLTSPRRIYVYL